MRRFFGSLLVAVSTIFIGCGGSGTVTPNVINSAGNNLLSKDFLLTPIQRWSVPRLNNLRSTAAVAQTSASSITSLQYFIQFIKLCEDLTLSGTGYSNSSGCSTIYESPDSAAVSDLNYYNTYSVTEAMDDTNENHFVDFMTAEGRAKIAKATSISAGTYKYALINFMRPIKVKAEFKDGSGTTLYYTKTTTSGIIASGGTDSGGREIEYIRPSNLKTAPAEVMTYMLNNGGTWFPFLTPFTVEKGDSVFIDFVFNPANFATASEQSSCDSGSSSTHPIFDSTNCVSIDMPYAKMAPVPRKAGETTRKEVYLIDYETGTSLSKARVELYYSSADPSRSVRGVDTAVVMDATATVSASNILQGYKASETDNVVTLYGYNSSSGQIDTESLTGLTRRQDGTLTIKCNFSNGFCPSADGSSVTRSYTYEGEAEIN